MGNPLSDVSQDFWGTLRWFDSKMSEIGAESYGYEPLAPQFEYLQKVDTDEIRRIAAEVWQAEQGLVPQRFDEARALTGQANQTLESWRGQAKNAYQQIVAGTDEALVQVNDPANSLSEALHSLAESYDKSLTDIIAETADATGEMWEVISDEDPEDVIDTMVSIAMYLLALLVSIIVFCQKAVDAETTNIDNVKKTIADCQSMTDSVKA